MWQFSITQEWLGYWLDLRCENLVLLICTIITTWSPSTRLHDIHVNRSLDGSKPIIKLWCGCKQSMRVMMRNNKSRFSDLTNCKAHSYIYCTMHAAAVFVIPGPALENIISNFNLHTPQAIRIHQLASIGSS